MAVYVDKDFRAHRYLLCQPNEGSIEVVFNRLTVSLLLIYVFEVNYVTKDFDLTDPSSAFEFIFQLYNFLADAKADNEGLRDPEIQLLNAKNSVARKGYLTLSKRKREQTGNISHSSRGPPAPGGAQDSFGNQSIQTELARAGYTIDQPIEGLTPLTPVSRNSRRYDS